MRTANQEPETLRLSRRIAGAAVCLFALAFTDLCSAATATFGPGNKYSIELPDTWTAQLQKDQSLGANGSGGLTLNAFIGSTETSPEALMEKIITRSTEKKAGYKLIEKGTVKTKAGREAHLHRYQLDAKVGTEVWVDYYFQLAEQEVVILVFAFPSDAPKSIRGEIEAILNSVKVASAAGSDDSWLTAPPDKPKESSKAAGAGDSEIAGKYVSTQQSSDYIILKADGTMSYEISGESGTGTYTRKGAMTITLKFGDDADDAKLEKDTIVDAGGKRWVRTTASSAPAAPKPAGTTITFATNCSVELPAGWTGKAAGARLEAKGPTGATLEGSSMKDATFAEAHALRVIALKKKFQEVDKDEISTKAGAKGTLVYLRYDDDTTAEIAVYIQVKPDQLVTLRFVAPNAPAKLDPNFQRAVEHIFSSLKITE